MNLTTTTRVIVVATIALLVGYDVLPFITEVDGDTISEVVRDAGIDSPAVPWAAGFLLGHFFWPGRREVSHAVAIGFAVAVAVTFHLLRDVVGMLPMIALVAAGAWCGHLVWPLERDSDDDESPASPRADRR